MPDRSTESLKLRCIDEAYAIIEAKGVENLSLREVARRLGVSHQAPYKHFPTRDHILAAIVARCFSDLSDYLALNITAGEGWADLGEMGVAYLNFARENPLKYRLMFNSPLPNPAEHPEMLANANHAFGMLHNQLGKLTLTRSGVSLDDPAKHDALFIWSTLHGVASLMQSDIRQTLDLSDGEVELALANALSRIGRALNPSLSSR